MDAPLPPPLPKRHKGLSWPVKLLLVGSIMVGLPLAGIGLLRNVGLIQPYVIPGKSMSPAIVSGDHVIMEKLTYLVRKPRRGDIMVFMVDHADSLPKSSPYAQRIVGESGDLVRITNGQLYINDQAVVMRNAAGEIQYGNIRMGKYLTAGDESFKVPDGQYFMLGDNSSNSFDSRFLGGVLTAKIIGKASYIDWPPSRAGIIK